MSKLKGPLFLILCVVLIVFLQFGFLFLLAALLPTLVAYYVDNDRRKPTFKIVGACNVAALLPSLGPMIHASIKLKHYDMSPLMGDPRVWLMVYSGAAGGWCLIYLCRLIARFIVAMMYEYNVMALEGVQKDLVEEWGQQIKQPPEDQES